MGCELLEDGDLKGARKRFAAAADDAVAEVARSARAGLAEVDRRSGS
jgi:hypothetical protein